MRHLPVIELARQLGLISPLQYDEAGRACERSPETSPADFLIERGWLLPGDRQPLEYLAARRRQRAGPPATEHADAPEAAAEPSAPTIVNERQVAATIVHV